MIDTRLTPVSIFISRLDTRFDDSTGSLPLVGDWRVLYSKLSHWPYVFFPRDGFSLKSQTFLTTDLSFSPPRMMMPMMILFRSIIPDSLARVLLRPAVLVLSFVFCLFAVCPFVLFVCPRSLSIFSLSPKIILTLSFRRWRFCNPDVEGFSFVGKSNFERVIL